MLTNGQKRALHSAAREIDLSDEDRRLVQFNIGGFVSAADQRASRYGFICVMAWYENRAGGKLRGSDPGYWQLEERRADPGDAVRYAIEREATALGWTRDRLEQWIGGVHMTSGAFRTLRDLPPYWLKRVLDGLLAIRKREAG